MTDYDFQEPLSKVPISKFSTIAERIKKQDRLASYIDAYRPLSMNEDEFMKCIQKNIIPYEQITFYCFVTGVNMVWLLTGHGNVLTGDPTIPRPFKR